MESLVSNLTIIHLHALQSSQALQRGRHVGHLLQTAAERVKLPEDVVLTEITHTCVKVSVTLLTRSDSESVTDHLKSNCLFSGFSLSLSLTLWKLR